MEAEDRFFLKKLELDYGQEKAVRELKKISQEVDWLAGWPKSRRAFWNGEAFMWGNKISKKKRELIRKELKFLRGRNLDLGCGSYSYVSGSVGVDVAEKMLLLNSALQERVVGDLEQKLPFTAGEFDSVTLVFVLDYIRKVAGLLAEAARVLKEKGKLAVVQAVNPVNKWQGQQVVKKLAVAELKTLLAETGFKVKCFEKEGLVFWKSEKLYKR